MGSRSMSDDEKMRGFYLVTSGGYEGRVGLGGCPCDECNKLRERGYEKIMFNDATATVLEESEYTLIGSIEDVLMLLQSFIDGTPLSELPEGTEDIVRSQLRHWMNWAANNIMDGLGQDQAFESFAVQHAKHTPPGERN